MKYEISQANTGSSFHTTYIVSRHGINVFKGTLEECAAFIQISERYDCKLTLCMMHKP